jgi:hypothetical protein
MRLRFGISRSVRPPGTPIALRDLKRDRLLGLSNLSLLALPRSLIEIGSVDRASVAREVREA